MRKFPKSSRRRLAFKATVIAWIVGSAVNSSALLVYLAVGDGLEGIFQAVLVAISLYTHMLLLSVIPVLLVSLITYSAVGWMLETHLRFTRIAGLVVFPSSAIAMLLTLALLPFSIGLVVGLLYLVLALLPYSLCTAYVIARSPTLRVQQNSE
jgi:hypothetical protein